MKAVDEGGHDACAGHAEGVTNGDRSAVDVELFLGDSEFVCRSQHLHGERFVDFEEVDVVDGQVGAIEGGANCVDWAKAHDLGVEARYGTRHDACQRLDSELRSASVAHDNDGGGAIVEWACVTGGNRAVFAEDWLEATYAFDGGAFADTVVLADHGAVGEGVRRDLVLEEASVASFLCSVL